MRAAKEMSEGHSLSGECKGGTSYDNERYQVSEGHSHPGKDRRTNQSTKREQVTRGQE